MSLRWLVDRLARSLRNSYFATRRASQAFNWYFGGLFSCKRLLLFGCGAETSAVPLVLLWVGMIKATVLPNSAR